MATPLGTNAVVVKRFHCMRLIFSEVVAYQVYTNMDKKNLSRVESGSYQSEIRYL